MHEVLLRTKLWHRGLRYRKNVSSLPGKPDIVFTRAKVAIFCDGDFWHGRGWAAQKQKLSTGHNSAYWIQKIGRNIERDKEITLKLEKDGWVVLRFWETDIIEDPERYADLVFQIVRSRLERENEK